MTTCTPIYGLTYAICSDRPCDIGDTFCQFANEVEAELDRLDAIIDRTVDSIPMAKVRLTEPFSWDNGIGGNANIPIPFDTVDVDTADMVDLTANSTRITLPRFGRYSVSFQIVISSVIPAGDIIGATMLDAFDQYLSDASAPAYLNSAANIRYTNSGSPDTTTGLLSLVVGNASAGIMTFSSATATVYWMGDL